MLKILHSVSKTRVRIQYITCDDTFTVMEKIEAGKFDTHYAAEVERVTVTEVKQSIWLPESHRAFRH